MELNTQSTISIAINRDAVINAAYEAARRVQRKEARRQNIITLVAAQTDCVVIITVNDERSHHFGTLLGSVRWSILRSEFVVSLNDAITDLAFKLELFNAFARGLGIDAKELAVDTAPILAEPIPTLIDTVPAIAG